MVVASDMRNRKQASNLDENFREVFMHTNVKEERMLCTAISQIEREQRRRAAHSLQKQREFLLSRQSKPEPIIIVERPPAYKHLQKAYFIQYGLEEELNEQERTPRYMRQLKSRRKLPSTLTTLDAYTVRASKKANLWEPKVATEEGVARFSCHVPPSVPLSKEERVELDRGWHFHRPKSPIAPKATTNFSRLRGTSKEKQYNKEPKKQNYSAKTFVTELPRIKNIETDLHIDRTVDTQVIQDVSIANRSHNQKLSAFLQFIAEEQSESKLKTDGRPYSSSRLEVKRQKPQKPRTATGHVRYLTSDERKGIENWLLTANEG